MNDLQELSTFSHEINNSLTLIYGQIQYIEKTNDTLTKNEHWNRMKDDFSSLFDFIHQFLAGYNFCRCDRTFGSDQSDQ